MAYYPKSQIKTNLYSSGEYNLKTTNESYIGFYYETSNGKRYTGKFPNSSIFSDIELYLNPDIIFENGKITKIDSVGVPPPNKITIQNQPSKYYVDSTPTIRERSLPLPSITLPTEQDYKNGRMIRYFSKKRNELIYLEVSLQTYQYLSSGTQSIAWDLYDSTQMYWIIKGFDKQQTYDYNINLVKDIEKRKKWYGFSKFLKEDYTKYYKNLSS